MWKDAEMTKLNIDKNYNNRRDLFQEKKLPSLLSARELALYLHKSIRWIQIENSAGRLPKSFTLGRSRFWIAEDVEIWLQSKREGVIRNVG